MLEQKEILNMDATSIASAIRNQKLTSITAVRTFVNHIKKVNPYVNAVVEDRFTEAFVEAKQIDKQNKQAIKDKPLLGVPISVKESFHVKGMKTTGGLIHRQDIISKQDAEIVTKLKHAGAIIICKTNTPTLCFSQETDNKLYGRTNNPWDITRTAGGSSGGEGALLGAGGAAVGVGSDIGGSIRFPCHFNGVIGFKPGTDQVSFNGHFPLNDHPLQTRMLGMGPMGKSVRDMEMLYNIIADKPFPHKKIDQMKIDIFPTDVSYPLSTATKDVLEDSSKFLTDSHAVNRMLPPFFEESAKIWQEIMSIDGAEDIKKLALNSASSSVVASFIKEKMTGSSTMHPYLSWALIGANLFKPSQKRLDEIKNILQRGDELLDAYLDDRLLLFPVYHTAASSHGSTFKEIFSIKKTYIKYMPYTAYANVWGLPALIVPIGVDEKNLPISVQIMSKTGNEHAIFSLGKQLEEQFRGYSRSKLFD
ncbi:amidase [Virgibacillus sp. W0430]|uniref:amidase n=1 Tax=Virgibacillus sp. W0430 TaxID=3391580 RepID=UPI003F468906